MKVKIRDKFPNKKRKVVTVKVCEELYNAVMCDLEKGKNTFSEFVDASMMAFMEEVSKDKLKKSDPE